MTHVSELAVYELDTRLVRNILKTSQLIEAPNWTRDGQALLVNCDGRLFRVMLAAEPALDPLNTGFACKLNNDHGLSPDGRWLAISDHVETGQSCIYVLPTAGGEPRRVTALTPSYWHGWAPDGATLAYCAARGGVYDIYSCPVSGGPERRLTDGQGHSDGPDYTPDGEWIWFNSSRSGTMQLWRMHPDGTGLQQMTDDDRVNWFPHPSPDGRHIAYLAYETGTEGHPRNRNVQLRLMPAAGGPPEVLLDLFGGQGSINVPSWSPDSRRFAFVRYNPDAT